MRKTATGVSDGLLESLRVSFDGIPERLSIPSLGSSLPQKSGYVT